MAIESRLDEHSYTEPDPVLRARGLALAKARLVARSEPSSVVIGADQVAHMDGEVFGKPADADDHFARLRAMRGRSHALVTGVAVIAPDNERVFHETSIIWMRADVTDAELAAYVRSGEGAGCAAGYQAEHLGAQLIERVEGDWFNVIGLPIYRLVTVLRELGWRPDALGGAP